MPQVKGIFDVKRSMRPALDIGNGEQAAQIPFGKVFHGPLQAASVEQMLAVGMPVNGSAAYVAAERISGSLAGKAGSFSIIDPGALDRRGPALLVKMVPDSGIDARDGLRGCMQIDIVEGSRHSNFDDTPSR